MLDTPHIKLRVKESENLKGQRETHTTVVILCGTPMIRHYSLQRFSETYHNRHNMETAQRQQQQEKKHVEKSMGNCYYTRTIASQERQQRQCNASSRDLPRNYMTLTASGPLPRLKHKTHAPTLPDLKEAVNIPRATYTLALILSLRALFVSSDNTGGAYARAAGVLVKKARQKKTIGFFKFLFFLKTNKRKKMSCFNDEGRSNNTITKTGAARKKNTQMGKGKE